jgi:AhpD family alkylhydroperoxidase
MVEPQTCAGGADLAKDYIEIIDGIDEYALKLKALIPDTLSAFGHLSRVAQTPGALDRKTKELIALSIAVAGRCDGCIGYHVRGALRAGATRQELAEALGVAVQMGGGPALDSATDALRAYDQFSTL